MAAPAGPSASRGVILGAGAVLIVAVVVAFALLQSPAPPSPPPALAAGPSPSAAPAVPPPGDTAPPAATATPATMASESAPSAAPAETPAAWEASIDRVLQSNVDEAQMAQILINLLPTLPEEGQIEAANHISNLLPDANYNSIRPLLLNPNISESVQSVFFTDLMNRDDSTKLHAFLDIAQIPNHPFHDEALSDLQIYVGDDYGTDWGKWTAAVNTYISNAASAQ